MFHAVDVHGGLAVRLYQGGKLPVSVYTARRAARLTQRQNYLQPVNSALFTGRGQTREYFLNRLRFAFRDVTNCSQGN